MSGRPISAFGEENPFDSTSFQSFFICVANCDAASFDRTYELRTRGSEGRTPWIFDLGANVTFDYAFSVANLQVKLAVYNLFNQQRATAVDESLFSTDPVFTNTDYRLGTDYQAPRYGLLTFKLDF
jgi:outer membrane receptor protein involved in Fe transport